MPLPFPKTDIMKLTQLLDDFENLCDAKGVKFKEYTPEQIMAFINLYKQYKMNKGNPPPF